MTNKATTDLPIIICCWVWSHRENSKKEKVEEEEEEEEEEMKGWACQGQRRRIH